MERGGPTARNHVALQSYHKLAMFWPKQITALLSTPMMMIIPGLDKLYPAELQKEMFDKLTSPIKKAVVVKDKGHLNLLGGKGKDRLLKEQVDFIREVLGMKTVVSRI